MSGLSGIDVRTMEPLLSQSLLEDKFYLADQVMYGSSRLGVKTYLPSQYQYHWNASQTLAQNQARWDSGDAAYRMPWYSDGLQSLVRHDQLSATGVAQGTALWSNRIIGQKRYELTNHLGNVLGVVSDKVTEVAMGGASKEERATLKAAYDYYPFGMVMPSRSIEDQSINCIPVSRTRYVREVVQQQQFSAGGLQSITGRSVGIRGSVVAQLDNSRAEVVRGEGMADDMPIEIAMPVGTLLGSSDVGVRLSCLVEGQGEIVAQLRWYPQGWSNEDGPVGDAYEVLNEAMVPDGGPLTVEAGTEDQPLPLYQRSNGGLALVLKSVNSGSGRLGVAEVAYETIIRAVQTYVVLSCDTDGVWGGQYAYGFNGQRKTDEISGPGNHNTATFWEYDTRLGLRWNTDPVRNHSISPYATFDRNPIFWADPLGNTVVNKTEKAQTDVKTFTDERRYNSRGKDKGANPTYNKDFATWIKQWDDNKDIIVNITTNRADIAPYLNSDGNGGTTHEGGTIASDGKGNYWIYYDPSIEREMGNSPVLEEAYHLNDAMTGKEMSFGPQGQCCASMDIYDEVRAKQWVANSPGTRTTYQYKPYTNREDVVFNVDTHYGWIKTQRLTSDQIADFLMNGTVPRQYNYNPPRTISDVPGSSQLGGTESIPSQEMRVYGGGGPGYRSMSKTPKP